MPNSYHLEDERLWSVAPLRGWSIGVVPFVNTTGLCSSIFGSMEKLVVWKALDECGTFSWRRSGATAPGEGEIFFLATILLTFGGD